jgi:hypothetical protein
MSWSTVLFDKYNGKTLPEIIVVGFGLVLLDAQPRCTHSINEVLVLRDSP